MLERETDKSLRTITRITRPKKKTSLFIFEPRHVKVLSLAALMNFLIRREHQRECSYASMSLETGSYKHDVIFRGPKCPRLLPNHRPPSQRRSTAFEGIQIWIKIQDRQDRVRWQKIQHHATASGDSRGTTGDDGTAIGAGYEADEGSHRDHEETS